jgi:hypothetical protein
MTSVSHFAQYLLKLDPQRNQARLTFFNFLKSVLEPTTEFAPEVVQMFYARILQFDNWRNDSASLAETVSRDVTNYVKQFAAPEELGAWAQLRHADTLQVVHLKAYQDLEDLIENEHAARRKSGDEIRTVRFSDQQILMMILSTGGGLEIKVYPNLALVWGAQLRAVAPVTHLHYGADFELMPYVKQILEGTLLTTHCFHVDQEGAHGLIARGYTFQKFETFIRAKLAETQDLFFALKKVERHFINPQSDTYYQDMVSRLERANRMLDNPHPDTLATAERALNKGRLCLKHVFPNDRLLGLLVTHLEYGLNQRKPQKGETFERPVLKPSPHQ